MSNPNQSNTSMTMSTMSVFVLWPSGLVQSCNLMALSLQLAGVHVELAVNTTHPNIPILLNRYFPLASEFLHFVMFDTTGVKPTDFTIPTACKP